MFIKCNNELIHLSDAETYEIESIMGEGLYLFLPNKKIMLLDAYDLRQGRPKLPDWAVDDLFDDVVDEIAKLIQREKKLRVIDVQEIELNLLNDKYEQKWLDAGYITLDADGGW